MNFQSPPSRLPDVGTTIFTVMSRMAMEYGAINLSQGFPDFPVDSELITLVSKYMQEGYNQYAPMPGVPVLQKTIAEVATQLYGCTINAESEVTITAGGTEALYAAITAFVTAGDEVILFDPCYDSYDPAIRLNGGIPVHLKLHPPDFTIDWDRVRKAITKRTKMILINTPHNPTGTVFSANDMKQLEEIAVTHGLLVLSDEVYEHIIFDNLTHQSVLRSPALAAQCIALFSFGKTFHVTGWRMGYVIAPAPLTHEIRKAHQFITFSIHHPVQRAFAEYMQQPERYRTLGAYYQQKRDYFLDQLQGSSFEPIPSHGSYFQLLSYKNISAKTEVEMAEELTKKHKVACIPVSVFYHGGDDHKLLRFCFAKNENTLRQAAEILRKL